MNEEQTQLYDAVRRFVGDAGRPSAKDWARRTQAVWPGVAQMGLLGMAVGDTFGGSGGSARDVATVMEAWGHGLLRAPLVGTAVVGAALLSRAGSEAQQKRWLPAIVRGECRVALADLEPGARYDRRTLLTRAIAQGGRYRLDGRKANVVDGDVADLLLVTARMAQGDGMSLFLVEAARSGVQREAFASLDGGGCAHIGFEGLTLGAGSLLGPEGQAEPLLDEALDRGLAALCSEAVGSMQALLGQTASYLKQRHQFGQPLAQFQALQHHIADMALDTGAARSAALMAAAAVDAEADGPAAALERHRTVAAAKSFVGEAGRRVGEVAVQLHGGMGMTDELAIGHHFKRLHAIDLTWGDAAHHLDVYARGMGPA